MMLVLRTERLVISPLGESDLDAFVAYRRHPDVARYQSWSPEYSLTDARALLAAQPRTTLPARPENGYSWLSVALSSRWRGVWWVISPSGMTPLSPTPTSSV